jgi:hypothetical protein
MSKSRKHVRRIKSFSRTQDTMLNTRDYYKMVRQQKDLKISATTVKKQSSIHASVSTGPASTNIDNYITTHCHAHTPLCESPVDTLGWHLEHLNTSFYFPVHLRYIEERFHSILHKPEDSHVRMYMKCVTETLASVPNYVRILSTPDTEAVHEIRQSIYVRQMSAGLSTWVQSTSMWKAILTADESSPIGNIVVQMESYTTLLLAPTRPRKMHQAYVDGPLGTKKYTTVQYVKDLLVRMHDAPSLSNPNIIFNPIATLSLDTVDVYTFTYPSVDVSASPAASSDDPVHNWAQLQRDVQSSRNSLLTPAQTFMAFKSARLNRIDRGFSAALGHLFRSAYRMRKGMVFADNDTAFSGHLSISSVNVRLLAFLLFAFCCENGVTCLCSTCQRCDL